ncbi:MarR family winged helix-turn-helix transcriptional regulator [Actinomycetes bacterium M1A6_2h]
MTNWLTADEQRTWRRLLQLGDTLAVELNRQLYDDHELSLADYDVLGRLHEASDHTLRAGDLAATLSWEQSRLSHQLGRMIDRGLVRKRRCADDRRGFLFSLTESGRDAIELAAPGHVDTVRALVFDKLTADQVRGLGEILEAVLGQHARR